MNRLPVETLRSIFKSACTDCGETGCALSMVSRYVRDVSAPMRYNSISLRGARQIRGFLELLRRYGGPLAKAPKTQRGYNRMTAQRIPDPTIEVEHLFLTDIQGKKISLQPFEEWAIDPADSSLSKFVRIFTTMRTYTRSTVTHTMRLQEAAQLNAESAVDELLVRLAPALAHLCIDQRLIASAFYPPALPALVELTIRLRGSYHMPGLGPSTIDDSKLPALERLHLLAENWLDLSYWPSGPPPLPSSLKLVRFSTVADPLRLLSMMTRSLWASKDSLGILLSRRPNLPLHPPHLESPFTSWSIRPSNELDEWRKAASANHSILDKVFVVEDAACDVYDVDRLYEEWLARVQGEEGCWKQGTPLSLESVSN
jgi:hypothetical protein